MAVLLSVEGIAATIAAMLTFCKYAQLGKHGEERTMSGTGEWREGAGRTPAPAGRDPEDARKEKDRPGATTPPAGRDR